MRTTIDLDDKLVKEVMELLDVNTKKEAVQRSLEELINQKRRKRLKQKLGKFDLDLTLEDLEEMRSSDNE